MRNIILIGFMGCGKTSLGIRLSYRLRRTMTDTDKMIERMQQMTVSEIFSKLGEEEFRKMETQCLKELQNAGARQIISVGGGLPLKSENRKLLKRLGTVIYLRVTPQTVYKRLAGDTTRPLLQGEHPEQKVEKLLKERAPIYEEAADFVIDVDGKDLDTITGELLQLIGEKTDEGRMRV